MINMATYASVKGEAKATQTRKKVTPGGHVCEIISGMLDEYTDNEGKQRTRLIVMFDIKEGSDLDDCMKTNYAVSKQWNDKAGKDTQWPGTFRRMVYDDNGAVSPTFKGFIECVEQSNPGWKFGGDESALRGKKVGLVFRAEEFKGRDGSMISTVKPWYPCAASKAKDEPIPAARKDSKASAAPVYDNMTPAEDDTQLPF